MTGGPSCTLLTANQNLKVHPDLVQFVVLCSALTTIESHANHSDSTTFQRCQQSDANLHDFQELLWLKLVFRRDFSNRFRAHLAVLLLEGAESEVRVREATERAVHCTRE